MPVSYDQKIRLRADLRSEGCPTCLLDKQPGQSFCPSCFASLGRPASNSLRRLQREPRPGEYFGLSQQDTFKDEFFEKYHAAQEVARQRTFGYEVKIKVRDRGLLGSKEVTFHRVGSEKTARRAAVFKRGYIEVVSVTPFTSEGYQRAFGWGRM